MSRKVKYESEWLRGKGTSLVKQNMELAVLENTQQQSLAKFRMDLQKLVDKTLVMGDTW